MADTFDAIGVDPDDPEPIDDKCRAIAAALRRAGATNLQELLYEPKHTAAADALVSEIEAIELKHWQPNGPSA